MTALYHVAMATVVQENCNLLVSNEYSDRTRAAMRLLDERNISLELLEVILVLVSLTVTF